jgi:hypothetical protein
LHLYLYFFYHKSREGQLRSDYLSSGTRVL